MGLSRRKARRRNAPLRTLATAVMDDAERRSRAAPVIEHRNAKLLGLVGEIAGDAGARENDDAFGDDVEHRIVALYEDRINIEIC